MNHSIRFIAFLVWMSGCVTPLKAQAPSRHPSPDRGLEFSLKRFSDGSIYSAREDKGQVVLLDIWATWCEPCRDSLPFYETLRARYGQQGLRVYAINVDEDVSQVRSFIQENGIQLPVLLDTDAAVSESLFQIQVVPTSFLVDRQGKIRFRHDGIASGFDKKIEREVQLLLNETTSP